MKLTILGCNGAIPANGRFPTAQILDIGTDLILIDCGEGAQMQMQKFGIKSSRINHVLISHLHGDHYFGLIGFLNTQGLLGRTRTMHIYANEKIKSIIDLQTDYALPYPIVFHDLMPDVHAIIHDDSKLKIEAFPLIHSVPTHGFMITKKGRARSLLPDRLQQYEIPRYFYPSLAEGEDYVRQDGTIISNDLLTEAGKGNKTYAYCSDTSYTETILPYIAAANLLYHEATYLESAIDKAVSRQHSTARQAATIALMANVQQLLIGHYSSKYKSTDDHLDEAKSVFENTRLAEDGLEKEIV